MKDKLFIIYICISLGIFDPSFNIASELCKKDFILRSIINFISLWTQFSE